MIRKPPAVCRGLLWKGSANMGEFLLLFALTGAALIFGWRWIGLGALVILSCLGAYYRRASLTDPLTSLGNLRLLRQRRRKYARTGVLRVWYLDLDRLKEVNDTRGHSAGNDLLCTLASGLKDVPGADAYRIGGDEFLLIASGDGPADLPLSGALRASWGVARGTGGELDELIRRAEADMYRNKER